MVCETFTCACSLQPKQNANLIFRPRDEKTMWRRQLCVCTLEPPWNLPILKSGHLEDHCRDNWALSDQTLLVVKLWCWSTGVSAIWDIYAWNKQTRSISLNTVLDWHNSCRMLEPWALREEFDSGTSRGCYLWPNLSVLHIPSFVKLGRTTNLVSFSVVTIYSAEWTNFCKI